MVWNSSEGTSFMVEGDMLSRVLKSIHDSLRSCERLDVVVITRTSPEVGVSGVSGAGGRGPGFVIAARADSERAGRES